MFTRIYPVLELPASTPIDYSGAALAKIVELHPDVEPLLDFYAADPVEMAYEVGMVSPADDDDVDADLAEIDFGPKEWHEPTAAIPVVEHAINVLRADPDSIRRLIYDPTLSQLDVIRDLERLLSILIDARDRETRFHLAVDGAPGHWPRPGR